MLVWDGITRAASLGQTENDIRRELADAARTYDWDRVIDLVSKENRLVNSTRPGGSTQYAPLHQAAHGGASAIVVETLLELGAWRTLQNARGERPVDVAERLEHSHLLKLLTPNLKRRVPIGVLLKLQNNLHGVIRDRVGDLIDAAGLRLPELEPLLEYSNCKIWFEVPRMAGGFLYNLAAEGVDAKLVSESWCRLADGSGQRHEVTSLGSKLIDEGFI